MKVTKEALEEFVNEAVISMGKARAKRELQAFETAIRPFIQFWDEGLDSLFRAQLTLNDEDAALLAHYVREFKSAGSNLSAFLRSKRLKMLKSSK